MTLTDGVLKKELKNTWIFFAIGALILAGIFVWLQHRRLQVEVRNHNLQVFAEMMACNDHESTNASECQQAAGKFMLEEYGLFEVHQNE